MRISKRKIQLWPIILILILNANFFFVEPITEIANPLNNYHNKVLIVSLIFLMFIIYLFKGHFSGFSQIDLMISSFLIIVLMIFFIQLIEKEDSFVNLCSNMYFLFSFLLYFPLKQICNASKYDLIKIFIYTGVIYTISNLIIFLYLKNGHIYSYSMPLIQYVNSNLRLPQCADIVGFTFILTLYYLCRLRKSKLKYLLMLTLMGVVLIFVAQVRMMSVAVIISSFVVIYFSYKQKYKKIGGLLLLFVGISITIFMIDFLYTGDLELVNRFLGQDQRYASAMYRFEEIKHYSKYMFMNVIFGFGYTEQSDIIVYALTDIGIFAFVFRYGIIGVVWLMFCVKVFIGNIKFVQDKALYYGLISFFGTTFISLSMFDPQRVVIFPILFALVNSTITISNSNARNS